jgi:hypothetical protein
VNVTVIMYEKTESVGTTSGVIIVVVLHNRLVDSGVLITRFVHQPVNDPWDGHCNVPNVLLEVRVVIRVPTLIEVRNVYEMPVGLPSTPFILDHVSKRCALHKWMIFFRTCDGLIGHCSQDFFCLL